MKNDILIKRCKICYFNLQVKGRNKTHDLNTKPGLQFRSHTQELEHKLTEILSSLDSRSSSRDQELEFFESDWLTVAVIVKRGFYSTSQKQCKNAKILSVIQ